MAKRKFLFILILALALACFGGATALAESESAVTNGVMENWEGGIPNWWNFSSSGNAALVECIDGETNQVAQIQLTEEGYGYLTQEVTLEPETLYRVTCRVMCFDATPEYPAFNMNFMNQMAETSGVTDTGNAWQTVEMYVRTNVDEEQTYLLRVGLGNEDSLVTGNAYFDDVTIERVEEAPAGATVQSLIGSAGYTVEHSQPTSVAGDATSESSGDEESADVSYNNIGVALCGMLLLFAVYFVMTSRWAPRWAKNLSKGKILAIVFALAFLFRVYTSIQQEGHITDMTCFKAWAVKLAEVGPGGFYDSGIFADYPPLYMYVLYLLGGIQQLFGIDYNSDLFKLIIEMPAILADLGLAWVVYRFAKKRLNPQTAAFLSLFILFSPLFITTSSSWGQIDSIFLLGLIGVAYLVYRDKKVYAAWAWMALLLLKPQALIVSPVLLAVFLGDLFRRDSWKRTLAEIGLSLAGMAVIYTIVALPMKGSQGFFYVFEQMLETTGQYAYGTVNAFNLMGLLGGNWADVNSMAFLTTYKNLGTLFIVLIIIVAMGIYLAKREKKHVFLLMAFMVAAVFTLGHEMHERYLVPAVGLLLFAAIIYRSRRLLVCAVGYSALAFYNVYVALIFKQDWIYDEVVIIGGILSLILLAYLIYCMVCVFTGRGRKEQPLEIEDYTEPTGQERALKDAKVRLETMAPHQSRRMVKKDYLIMTIISVVYAVFAFTNLGSTVIPQRNEPVEQTGGQIVFELEELSQVEKFKYYAGYCEGKFELLYSEDGIHYEKLDLNQDEAGVNSLEHEYSDMFKWHFYNVGQNARYLKIVLDDGYMEFREVAFTGVDDTVLPIRSAQLTIDGETTDASYMIDEQDQVPQSTSYMTDMYFDEVYHARTAYEYMEGIYPYEITHPPLGKSIITLGIQLFGFTPFGWRFMGALFGVLILPVLYIFAKRLFKKTKWAAVATILFAADFMHFSLTRIATIDSYSLFFILLMYLCMYEYTQHNFNKEKLSRTLLPLGLCGLAFGLGAATKWICLYAGVGLFVMFFYTVYRRAQEYRVAKAEGMEEIAGAFRRKLVLTLLFCVGVFIVIPIIIYCLSYIPYFNAKEDFGLAGIWGNQQYMLNYHGNLKTDSPHPYQSNCYTWPFDLRPVFFFRGYYLPENMVSVIWCMASPLLAWGGLAAVLYLLGLRGKGKKFDAQGIPFIVVGALAQYLPWMIISREVFIYHYFATLPFVVFAIIYVLRYWEENYKWGKKATWIVVGVAILLFLAFYPALTGVPMSREWASVIRWLPLWPI